MNFDPHDSENVPRVSIGLPVLNGELFLAEALESLLGQTFTDFEVVISDNASTDGTAEICRRFAANDSRIRYFRNDTMVGAAENFDRTFKLSRAKEYFKWAACDDLCAPEFLERCVALLDADPGAVLAYPKTTVIDAEGNTLSRYDVKLETDSEHPVQRFQVIMAGHKCYEIFGLIRRADLETTPLMGAYSHGDGVLLARLALRGRLEEIPEFLFFSRRHPGQSARMEGDRHKYAIWFAPHLAGKIQFPVWRTYYEFFRSIHLARGLSLYHRALCYRRFYKRLYGARAHLKRDVAFQVRRLAAKIFPRAQRPLRGPKA